jgi:small subunit ribosomal protein S8
MMTDPIADMLTRIRNAARIERPVVDMPNTRVKRAIAQVLKDEGFIHGYEVGQMVADEAGHPHFQAGEAPQPKSVLRIVMKYGPEGERVVRHIQRYSKPGLRVYKGYSDLRPVLDGLGIAVLSTSRGVMSDRQARTQKVGGEVLCTVW